LEPEEIKAIRKKLRQTQAQAGTTIGGGPRAFQAYEAGDMLPGRAISSALTLLAHNPEGLIVLEGRQVNNHARKHAPAWRA
jgi:HTH-type transcriptional regulator/antitoxin MqsA